jgi:hypothetical protein
MKTKQKLKKKPAQVVAAPAPDVRCPLCRVPHSDAPTLVLHGRPVYSCPALKSDEMIVVVPDLRARVRSLIVTIDDMFAGIKKVMR